MNYERKVLQMKNQLLHLQALKENLAKQQK
jgi:hypothetical protein